MRPDAGADEARDRTDAPPELTALNAGWRTDRVPVVLQAEAAECGLACLSMIASAHGLRTDLVALRQRFPLSLKGATMVDLVRMAEAMQLQARALRAEPEDLPALSLPCILHWDMNHFVVLVALKGGWATVHDPARGRRRLRVEELSKHFTGVLLELAPTPAFVRRDDRRRVTLRQLVGQVAGFGRSAGQILLLALALEFFVLLTPFFMQFVVDDVLVSGDRDWLVTLGVGFGLLVLIQAGTAAVRSWAVLVLSASVNLQWLGSVFAHLLRLPVAWFEKRHVGDVWSRFAAVQEIQKTLTTGFVEALLDGLMVVLALGVARGLRPELTEPLHLVERELRVPREVEPPVEEHRPVASREDEPIPVEPPWMRRAVRQRVTEQHRADLRAAERQSQVAARAGVDGVDREPARGGRGASAKVHRRRSQ